ncbi:hypothetical protein MTR67_001325 [Solanum verrucosum]|uniref:Uncharacterized protein n=1 Tax=Solanum verrucosum TaxID=315347 RepID=A0AAF0PQF0_SOLVR|nr:hypothetical protein MTR67_001325 [Solanum verrucosum]
MKNGKVIAYASKQLKVHEKNYPTHDLELAAVVFALKICRHYLYEVHVDVFTDCKSLQYVFNKKDLNLFQIRKERVVQDVHRLARLGVQLVNSTKGGVMARLGVQLVNSTKGGVMARLSVQLVDSTKCEVVIKKSIEAFSLWGDGVLRYQCRLFVLNVNDLREQILTEAHGSWYSIHPGTTKLYRDLWEVYWWNGMKKYIAEFVAECPNFQQVEIEHQKLEGLSQDINIPTWKWEDLNMGFIVSLAHTRQQHDSIWVIADRMIKSAHFLPIKVSYLAEDYDKLYLREMVRLHGVPLSIISNRGTFNVTHHIRKQTSMQISRSCRCNPRLTPTDRRVTHGPCWWSMVSICNLPQKIV